MRTTATLRTMLGPVLVGALTLATSIAPTTGAQAAATVTEGTSAMDEGEEGKLLLMLDASGSMKEKDPSGGTKMDAAKQALTGVVDDLPEETRVGLRVYGATEEGGRPTKAACADTQLAAPIEPLDTTALKKAIKGFEAKGETPIAHSLEEGLDDLGSTGTRNIILVSDGEESCVPDPCPVVKKLVKDGVDLRIDTVGFDVRGTARTQLECLADAGGGEYYDAEDADELATSLDKLSQKAVRQFSVQGTPITMTEDRADAPEIGPGRYTDTFSVSNKPRHARIQRTRNSIVHVGLVARPPSEGRENTDSDHWEVLVSTPDGEECTRSNTSSMEFFRGVESISVAASVNNEVTDPTVDDPCATSDELLVEVTHDEGKGTDLPVQLVYLEEPPVEDPDSLPGPVDGDKITGWTTTGDGSPEPVVGGGGFADAATVSPGSYEETIRAGEHLYYRVRVGYGQRAAFTARVRTEGTPLEKGGAHEMDATDHILFTVNSWNPALHELTRTDDDPENREHLSRRTPSLTLGEYIPEVRYRNKEISNYESDYDDASAVSMGGYYYFALGRENFKGDDLDAPLKVRIDVDVKGDVTGEPQFSGAKAPAEDALRPSPSATSGTDTESGEESSAAPATSEDEGGSPLPWIGTGLVAVLLLGAGAWFGLRRRAGAQDS